MKIEKVYRKEQDGSLTLVETNELATPTQEEIIANKEAELLAMYNELEALKSANS